MREGGANRQQDMCKVQVRKAFESEVKIAQVRLEGMKLYLGKDARALEEYKKRYESKLADGASTAGKRGTSDVGSAPPCHLLKDLRLLAEIKTEMEEKLAGCTTDTELKAAKAQQKELLAPGLSLGTAMKSATAELKKAMDLNEKGKLGGPLGKAAAKRMKTDHHTPDSKRRAHQPDIYETAFLHGKSLSPQCLDKLEDHWNPKTHQQVLEPALLINKSIFHEHLKSDGPLQSTVAAWKGTKWMGSAHRSQNGRAADGIQDCPSCVS